MTVTAADLFCGIGGFHAVASALGFESVCAYDSDKNCREIYERNWQLTPGGDIEQFASESQVTVPPHSVLFAGFPCQPFSKSGAQRGMRETRGTLFFNIARVLEERRPRLVVLENVRNLWSARHREDWDLIISILRDIGYRVSGTPLVSSPHRIPPGLGGTPQVRERIYINATYVPPNLRDQFDLVAPSLDPHEAGLLWDPTEWKLANFIPTLRRRLNHELHLSEEEVIWIDTWDDFRRRLGQNGVRLPGFPLWLDVWTGELTSDPSMPGWKRDFISKNYNFWTANRRVIDRWLSENHAVLSFPASRRKFEWQAGDLSSAWKGLIQLRPSGIRVKVANYIPAAVAMTQTSIFGPTKRRISTAELARLQGFPSWFSFEGQAPSQSYKQLGNAISIASAYHSVKAHIKRDQHLLKRQRRQDIVDLVQSASDNPFDRLDTLKA